MFKIDQKNKWAIDLSFHIPIPSFSLKITSTEVDESIELNTPLHIKASASAKTASGGGAVVEESVEQSETVMSSAGGESLDHEPGQ